MKKVEMSRARKRFLRWFLLPAFVSMALILSAFAFLLRPLSGISTFQKVRSAFTRKGGG